MLQILIATAAVIIVAALLRNLIAWPIGALLAAFGVANAQERARFWVEVIGRTIISLALIWLIVLLYPIVAPMYSKAFGDISAMFAAFWELI